MRSSPDGELWVVILAGGVGSRFWPASTARRPKQLLPLASDKPLIRETIERIEPLIPRERLRVLTSATLAAPIRSAVPDLGPDNFLLEPRAAGTAAVLAWAGAEIEKVDPNAVMVSLHSDHAIYPADIFRHQIREAAELAVAHQRLFTLGAVPDRPETGYGYIRVGTSLAPAGASAPDGDSPRATDGQRGPLEGAFEVASFVEKPDAATALAYVADGGYLWNTGLFVWRARDLLDQLERHTPEIAPLIPLLRGGDLDAFFERVPNMSIDHALLERSDRVGVLATRFNWDDIGAWGALFRTHPVDERDNVLIGEGIAVDTRGTALYADEGRIVTFGVEDLVVVRTSKITFVAHRDRAPELKQLLARLPDDFRDLE